MSENIPSPLGDEIDLRAILQTLWKARIVILFATLIPALVTFVVSFWFLPRAYQATAYVFIGNPIINFAETTDITIAPALPDIKSVAQLATAPGLLESVSNDPAVLRAVGNDKVSIIDSATAVNVGVDQLRLQVTDTNPQRAALLTNVWAEKVTTTVNATYGIGAIAETLDSQVLQSQKDYEQAQAALEDALSKSPVDAVSAQLQRMQADLKCVLDGSSKIMRVLDDLQTLEQELDGTPAETPLALHDGLALTALRQRSLTSQPCQLAAQSQASNVSVLDMTIPNMSDPNIPVLNMSVPTAPDFALQIDSASFAGFTVSTARTSTTQMRAALQAQVMRLQSERGNLEQEIPQLQADFESEQAQLRQFTIERDQSQVLYAALLQQQQRVAIVLTQSANLAAVSIAAVPSQDAVSRNVLVNTAVAGMLGLILSLFGVLAVDWWRKE
jgi:capsular polysaccharide biosynthesis protein